MNTATNPLDQIWNDYLTSKDCFKIAARSIKHEGPKFVKGTMFLVSSIDEATERIKKSRKDADDFFVLSLWVTFERFLINYIRGKAEKLKDIVPQDIGVKLHKKLDRELEYWRIDEVLDLLKGPLDGTLVGQAKQIKEYRDWIAHKNDRKPSPSKVNPKGAYDVLSMIVRQIETIDSAA